ncbi:peptidoglycan-associated lipoprotein Pal [Halocynthiibacter sp. C4]|uniref:peptidoglycan-associated lipoprotein Pal n=1 Tax=Halocynthiibacter sp. C4 TaxID=2992758 RepID=UPI00237C2DAD|nr:peptidoglycan-associated lipoprotein Pal [Halocynthiibacter sp. C4]MDE0588687.1 peptidoglycan-associated lipoprotein Pal [Halocynthiibacter sp. C4]
MKQFTKVALVVAALGLAACSNKTGGFGGGAGSGSGGLNGDVNDPTSVAYFNTTIGDRVLFEVDQSTLTEEGKATLAGQAVWLMNNGEYTAIIEGHADEQGTREYNLALGERRANAAYQFLVSQGVASNRLQTVSFGKERPLEICSEESCYRKNRRAVTVVAAGAGV